MKKSLKDPKKDHEKNSFRNLMKYNDEFEIFD